MSTVWTVLRHRLGDWGRAAYGFSFHSQFSYEIEMRFEVKEFIHNSDQLTVRITVCSLSTRPRGTICGLLFTHPGGVIRCLQTQVRSYARSTVAHKTPYFKPACWIVLLTHNVPETHNSSMDNMCELRFDSLGLRRLFCSRDFWALEARSCLNWSIYFGWLLSLWRSIP